MKVSLRSVVFLIAVCLLLLKGMWMNHIVHEEFVTQVAVECSAMQFQIDVFKDEVVALQCDANSEDIE